MSIYYIDKITQSVEERIEHRTLFVFVFETGYEQRKERFLTPCCKVFDGVCFLLGLVFRCPKNFAQIMQCVCFILIE